MENSTVSQLLTKELAQRATPLRSKLKVKYLKVCLRQLSVSCSHISSIAPPQSKHINVTLLKGSSPTLRCSESNFTVLLVTWTGPSGHRIKNLRRFHVSGDTLQIKRLRYSDHGVYKCLRYDGRAGKAYTEFDVKVGGELPGQKFLSYSDWVNGHTSTATVALYSQVLRNLQNWRKWKAPNEVPAIVSLGLHLSTATFQFWNISWIALLTQILCDHIFHPSFQQAVKLPTTYLIWIRITLAA